jgi:hypothetical protein
MKTFSILIAVFLLFGVVVSGQANAGTRIQVGVGDHGNPSVSIGGTFKDGNWRVGVEKGAKGHKPYVKGSIGLKF